MKAKLHLTSDSLKVNKGDCFTVTWGSETPESLYLIVDDGDSVQKYPVADNGSKTCWSTRAKKDIAVTLAATFNGKKQTVSVKVKVKDKQKFQIWKERMQGNTLPGTPGICPVLRENISPRAVPSMHLSVIPSCPDIAGKSLLPVMW